jgi:hypothetical protein
MVIGGYSGRDFITDVETVDLGSVSGGACFKPADAPIGWASVAIYSSQLDEVVVCQDRDQYDNSCYMYDRINDEWDYVFPTLSTRAYAADIHLSEDRWLIIGGDDGVSWLRSSEECNPISGVCQPYVLTLPEESEYPQLVQINSSLAFLWPKPNYGGAYLWQIDTNEVTALPELRYSDREGAVAGLVNRNGQQEIVVVGGYGSSTEILNLSTLEWRNGPDLPVGISWDSGRSVPFGNSFLIVAGVQYVTIYIEDIYLFDEDNYEWTTLPQKLQTPRSFFPAVLVPENYVQCP